MVALLEEAREDLADYSARQTQVLSVTDFVKKYWKKVDEQPADKEVVVQTVVSAFEKALENLIGIDIMPPQNVWISKDIFTATFTIEKRKDEQMSYKIERTEKEINDVLNQVSEIEESGESKFPGMTYEEGVRSALLWVMGEDDENPLDE